MTDVTKAADLPASVLVDLLKASGAEVVSVPARHGVHPSTGADHPRGVDAMSSAESGKVRGRRGRARD